MELDEKLEQFINNQRKGNRFMLVAVFIFIILAASTLFFSTRLSESEKTLKAKNDSLIVMKQHLDTIANQSMIMGESLTRQLESQKLFYDGLIKYSHEQDSIYFSTKKRGRPSLDSNANKFRLFHQLKPRVYVQYQGEMEQEKNRVFAILKEKNKYKLPAPEMIDLSYEKEIRFFNEDDEDLANDLLKLLGREYTIVNIESTSPLNQLEVWIGQPKMMDVQQKYDMIKGK
ncbi:MAG: hypothetical protein ACKVQB_05720 [Bacteroidia bacterium]